MVNVLIASVAFSCGSAALKWTDGFSRFWPSAVLTACFVTGAAFLARAASSAPVSTAVTIGLGIEAVAALGIGLLMFGERISPTQGLGAVLVLVGVALLRS